MDETNKVVLPTAVQDAQEGTKQTVAQVVFVPLPTPMPVVMVTLNGVSVHVSCATLEECVGATEHILDKIKLVVKDSGWDYG